MKKRFLSILMALCMMLTLAVPSVAAGEEDTGTYLTVYVDTADTEEDTSTATNVGSEGNPYNDLDDALDAIKANDAIYRASQAYLAEVEKEEYSYTYVGAIIELKSDCTMSHSFDGDGKVVVVNGNGHAINSENVRYGFAEGADITFNDVKLNFSYDQNDLGSGADLGLFYCNGLHRTIDGKITNDPNFTKGVNFTFNRSEINFINTEDGATDRLHGIYYDAVNGTITLNNSALAIKGFPEDAIEWGGTGQHEFNYE